MGYVFDAIAKAERSRRGNRHLGADLPEIQTLPIVPALVRPPAAADLAPDTAQPSDAPDCAADVEMSQSLAADDRSPRLAPAAPLPIDPDTLAALDNRLVAAKDPSSIAAEEYRAIRMQMLGRLKHRRHLVHVITSATPGEGKTITALNLGFVLSELPDRETLVVEANLRLPAFASMLGHDARPGLMQALRGESMLDEVIWSAGRGNLSVISAGGSADHDALQLLASPMFADVLRRLRHRFDHIIIDTAPATELADAGVVGALADDVMLVVRNGATPQPMIEAAVSNLKAHRAPVAGVLLTGTQPMPRRYRYGVR